MGGSVKVFFCEDTGDRVCIERYWCDCGEDTKVELGRFSRDVRPEFPSGKTIPCPTCSKPVRLASLSRSKVYRRTDTGEEVGGRAQMPAGACWENGYQDGPDGRPLTVMLPDGVPWFIDGRANNCTMPDDEEHRCWCRHGRPEDGTLHVDKQCLTCAAGGGSIATKRYHGFLHDGYLVEC